MVIEYDLKKLNQHFSVLYDEKKAVESLRDALSVCYELETLNPMGRPEVIKQQLNRLDSLSRNINKKTQWIEEVLLECSALSSRLDETLCDTEALIDSVGIQDE